MAAILVAACSKDASDLLQPVAPKAPIARFTVSPSVGNLGTTFQVDASGSTDARDTPAALEVRWDWEDDGTWDTAFGVTKTAVHSYAELGGKTIRLEVENSLGATSTVAHSVSIVARRLPAAAFVVRPPVGTVDTLFHFDASTCTDDVDPLAALVVRWDWENDGVWDTGWSGALTALHRYLDPGTWPAVLEVRNTAGLVSGTARTVRVEPRSPAGPTARFIVSPKGKPAREGVARALARPRVTAPARTAPPRSAPRGRSGRGSDAVARPSAPRSA